MGASHGRPQKPSVTNFTHSRIIVNAAFWTSSGPTPFRNAKLCRTPSTNNISSKVKKRRWPGLDRSCPQDRAICHPQSRHALDFTWEKSDGLICAQRHHEDRVWVWHFLICCIFICIRERNSLTAELKFAYNMEIFSSYIQTGVKHALYAQSLNVMNNAILLNHI